MSYRHNPSNQTDARRRAESHRSVHLIRPLPAKDTRPRSTSWRPPQFPRRGLSLADVATTGRAKLRFSKCAAQKLLSLWMAPDLLDGRGAGFGDARFVAREVATLVYQHAAIDYGCPHVMGGGPPHKRLQGVANGAQMGAPKVNGDQIGTQARC